MTMPMVSNSTFSWYHMAAQKPEIGLSTSKLAMLLVWSVTIQRNSPVPALSMTLPALRRATVSMALNPLVAFGVVFGRELERVVVFVPVFLRLNMAVLIRIGLIQKAKAPMTKGGQRGFRGEATLSVYRVQRKIYLNWVSNLWRGATYVIFIEG